MVGTTLGRYQVLEKIGEGGMGVVYKARDTELGRFVALKLLPSDVEADPERKRRFLHEARAASALNHPNIVTIHEIGHAGETDFLVLEHVEGESLKQRMAAGAIPAKEAASIARQVASALAAAHAAGIVHRDVKPGNIMVTAPGLVKVLDFGLAKLNEPVAPDLPTSAGSVATQAGMILGTAAYMSPEQAEGKRLDGRSDVFSLGVVLYEMLANRRPFHGDSDLSTMLSILRDEPSAVDSAPVEVGRIVRRTLAKRPESRWSAEELCRELEGYLDSLSSHSIRAVDLAARLRRPRVLLPVLTAFVAVVGLIGWLVYRQSRIRWASQTAPAEIARLAAGGKSIAAFDLAKEARRWAPDNADLIKLWPEVTGTPLVTTEPPGATLWIRQYDSPQQEWKQIGTSPMENVEVPRGFLLWKAELAGHDTTFGAHAGWQSLVRLKLASAGAAPPGMVAVPSQKVMTFTMVIGLSPPAEPYFIDRTEVTNQEFKKFIDAGGYSKRDWWKHSFRDADRTLGWDEAMARFRDATGRPGPSTWEGGSYPAGQENYPVSGVSWYEAAAYAEFAGKSLPTASHWYSAAEPRAATYIIPLSNFGGSGPAPVGQFQGVGPYGTVDMAGNLKEWCWNETGGGLRYLLGGSWSDPTYQFNQPDAQPSFNRSRYNGFRCVRYTAPPTEAQLLPVVRRVRDFSLEKPAGDEAFQVYRSLVAYDSRPLDAKIESVDESSPYWRIERVSFAAAYAGERVPAFVFVPRNGRPPYQTVVYHPGAGAINGSLASLDGMSRVDFLIRSGRAVIYPILWQTYDRRPPPSGATRTSLEFRGHIVRRVQDLMRSVEYVRSRSDLDSGRLAYLGASWGAGWAPVMIANAPHFRTAVLFEGGLWISPSSPELDPFNYLPRVRIPVLMMNGRYDYTFPLETSQKLYFRNLGSAEADKRHLVYETSHDLNLMRTELVREVLNWLDKYLGPVQG